MSAIWLVRHGECLANVSPSGTVFATDEDDPLTELGRTQASRVGAALRRVVNPSRVQVVSSSLRRARETAQIVGERLAPSRVLADERLVEKEASEGFDALHGRVWACLEELRQGFADTVCITHGHVLQALAARALGVADPMRLRPMNGGISLLYEGHLVSWNSVMHLRATVEPVERQAPSYG